MAHSEPSTISNVCTRLSRRRLDSALRKLPAGPYVIPAKPDISREPTSGLEPLTCSLRVSLKVFQPVSGYLYNPITKRYCVPCPSSPFHDARPQLPSNGRQIR
jgi:hypothetical protein